MNDIVVRKARPGSGGLWEPPDVRIEVSAVAESPGAVLALIDRLAAAGVELQKLLNDYDMGRV